VKVSVAMATYNGGPYLAAQLASLLGQDRLPDELVISDDGSCDETEQVVKEFAATAPFPVIWLRNPGRRGYQRNVDFALAATIGDVILLADQDDVWLERHVSLLAAPFETDPRLMVAAGDSQVMSADGSVSDSTVHDQMPADKMHATNRARGIAQFRQVLAARAVAGHSMAVRRSVLEVASPLPVGWMPDEWIFLIGAAMGRVLYVEEVISRFRRYARYVPGPEYRRAPDPITGLLTGPAIAPATEFAVPAETSTLSGEELARWQNLLSRLRYAGALLPLADQALAEATAKLRLLTFRATVRGQAAPVRAIRVLPWLLAGRYRRAGGGFAVGMRDLAGANNSRGRKKAAGARRK
jgi:hypothetical protein